MVDADEPQSWYPEIRTSAGVVRGRRQDGVDAFLGIPYAAAPVGTLRFQSPEPHAGWDGVRDADAFGPTSPQRPYPPTLAQYLPSVIVPGDEWLNLSVWAPAAAQEAPVVVWIHGGSLQYGTHALDLYDGASFARDGVALVGINYRLGVEGFGTMVGAPRNRGLADVIAALEWVQREIAAFGGDPTRVTVMGESAGSILVGALLVSPAARGLFGRAIMQSGMPAATQEQDGGGITGRMATRLGVPATAEAFAAVDPAALLDAQYAAGAGGSPLGGASGFGLTLDDALLPVDPLTALEGEASADIPVLVGGTSEEYRLWFVPSGTLGRISRLALRLAALKYGIGGRILRAYRRSMPDALPGEVLGTIAIDLILNEPIDRMLAARQDAPTWVYEFRWRTPVGDLGASHALELGFVFDRLRSPDSLAFAGADAPQSLADAMHRAWVAFIRDGDPGWEPSGADRVTRIFDEPDAGLERAPHAERRAALATRRSG